jgi:hypothetical protein
MPDDAMLAGAAAYGSVVQVAVAHCAENLHNRGSGLGGTSQPLHLRAANVPALRMID